MVNDIGPGMQMLIDALEAAEGDYQNQMMMPNGYIASIIRTAQIEIPIPKELQVKGIFKGATSIPAGGSYGAARGLFEMALMNEQGDIVKGPVGHLSPVEVARQLREWFELSPVNPWGNSVN